MSIYEINAVIYYTSFDVKAEPEDAVSIDKASY